MERVRFINHDGKDILFLNFSYCKAEEVVKTIHRAKQIISSRPENSLLTLTDVTDARFNDEVGQSMKEFTAHNKPYVKARADSRCPRPGRRPARCRRCPPAGPAGIPGS